MAEVCPPCLPLCPRWAGWKSLLICAEPRGASSPTSCTHLCLSGCGDLLLWPPGVAGLPTVSTHWCRLQEPQDPAPGTRAGSPAGHPMPLERPCRGPSVYYVTDHKRFIWSKFMEDTAMCSSDGGAEPQTRPGTKQGCREQEGADTVRGCWPGEGEAFPLSRCLLRQVETGARCTVMGGGELGPLRAVPPPRLCRLQT